MKIARLLLLALVLVALVSVFVGDRLHPLFGKLLPGMERLQVEPRNRDDAVEPEPEPVVHLLLLNGTETPNLAGQFSLLLDRIGCVAQRVDNAPHTHFASTLLINRRLEADRLARLAKDLGGVETIQEADTTADEDAVLVLGLDHEAIRILLDSLER